MRLFLLKALVANRVHHRVRGGYRLAKVLARSMDSVKISINGQFPLYVDLRGLDSLALALFQADPIVDIPYEPVLTNLFRRIVQPDDVVFDIGANLGLHTLTFSKLARKVLAFEPNPLLVPNLRKTVASLPNVRLLEMCLADVDSTVSFHISLENHLLSSMANRAGQKTEALAVEARSIDSLIADGTVPKPQVLKVDVEGAEMLVFRGAEKLLSGDEAPRFVVFEELNTPSSPSEQLGIVSKEAAEYLRSKGYNLFLITDDGLAELPAVRPPDANLLAVKGNYAINI